MKIRLLNTRKILTFQLRGASKTPSGLFTAFEGAYEYFDCCPVWFVDIGHDCQVFAEGAQMGDIGLLHDAFDLEEIQDYWQGYSNLPQFKVLKDKAEEIDAEITTSIIHENSLIGWFKPNPSGDTRLKIGRGETGEFRA